ncbi:MAG: ABC transporter ATP-binding protein [Acidimicrobiales bacterium]|nr:ABC transporter ATP-binding protein [Acidimicrobiales bacterium]
MSNLLELTDLSVRFGALLANDAVSLSVAEGEIVGLIGPNGSGKSTLLRAAVGIYRPSNGRVRWEGSDITGWPIHRVARLGLVRTAQHQMVFPSVSVYEAVRMAAGCSGKFSRRDQASVHGAVEQCIERLGLTAVTNDTVSSLPSGHLRRLGIALALAAQPRLLLLDEPAAGLNDHEGMTLAESIRRIRDEGIAVCVVDHDMGFILPLCDRVVCLSAGRNFAEGSPDEVARDPRVIEIYLGRRFKAVDGKGNEHDSP